MDIFIRIKNQYGQNLAYPACTNSRLFAQIAGTQTLTASTLHKIDKLGYKIKLDAHQYTSVDNLLGELA